MRLTSYIVNETDTSAATNMELAIVQAWNREKVEHRDLVHQAHKIVELLRKKGLRGKAVHHGNAKGTLSKEWKSWDVHVTTPKTDFTIGKNRISLKKEGETQLMSGGKRETNAVFKSAMDDPSVQPELAGYMAEIRHIVDNMVKVQSNVPVKGLRVTETPEVDIAELDKINADLNERLMSILEKSDNFKRSVVFEAASGHRKFDNTFATATDMLVFAKDGAWIKYDSLSDNSFITKLANKSKMEIRWKSVKHRGKYDIFSALKLTHRTVKEEFDQYKDGILNESKVAEIYAKIVDKIKKLWGDILNWVKAHASNLLLFLGIEVDMKLQFSL